MDLPPPSFFPHHRDHLRYGNVLHSPDFPPLPYGTHLPPPSLGPTHPIYQSPPPRMGYIGHSPLSPPHAFSQPHQPFLEWPPHPYEFDPPPKPYFIRNDHLAPPPRPEDMPLRFHDYPERAPIFEDEAFGRGCSDKYISGIPRNSSRNSHFDAMEVRTRILDTGDQERYRDGFYRSRGNFNRRDGDERGWDNGINGWDREMESDYDRRWDRDISHRGISCFIGRKYDDRRRNSGSISDWDPDMYHARDGDGRRWNGGITDLGPPCPNERGYDDKWNSGISDRDNAMCSGRDYEERRWHYGISELSCEGDGDESRLKFAGARLKPENRRPECSVNDMNLGRFNGRLERDVSKQEFIKAEKKRKLQKKNALHRIQRGKACSCSWHSRGYKCQHFPKKLSNHSFRAKAKEGSKQLEMKMVDNREEQGAVDLAISFKSNAFVAKPILAKSHPAIVSDFNSMDVDNKNLCILSDSSFDNSEEAAAKEDHLRPYLDHPSGPLGISNEPIHKTALFGGRSLITYGDNDLNGDPVKNEDLKDKMSQVPNTFGSGRTQASQPNNMRNAGNQLLGENKLQLTEVHDGTLNSYNCISGLPAVPQLISNATVSRNNDMVGFADNQDSRARRLQEDKFQPESHESDSSSEANASLPQMPAHLKEIPPALVNTPLVGVEADEEFRNLDSIAVVDCSSVSLHVSTGSHLLSLCHKEDTDQFDVPSFGATGKKSFLDGADQSLDIGSAEGSQDALSCTKIHSLSFDCSYSINGKRKTTGAQMDLPDTKSEVVFNKFASTGEVATSLVKNLVPDVEVDFVAKGGGGKRNASSMKMSSGIEDSAAGVDFGANDSVHGYMKKRKVVSPRSKLSSLSDDGTVADGFATDCSILVQGSARLAEWRTEQREFSESAATNKCDPADVEDFCENWSVAGSDETLLDGNKLQVNDGLAFMTKGQSLCADDKNGFCASNSDDGALASGFQMRSCISSPEEMPSYTDLKLSRNSEVSVCRSGNDKVFWCKDMSNGKPVTAHSNTFSLGKSLQKAASDSLPTNSKSSPSPVNDGSAVADKLNLLHGKLISSKKHLTSIAPRAFPGHHPICFGKSMISNINHDAKSRTWHRTCNSTGAVPEPKVQPSPLPPSHGTKVTRTIQSSYIRKGNSLVRKASPSGVTPLGLHGASSSVYRLTPCTDNLKINLASNSKIGVPDCQTQQGSALINVSKTTEEECLKPTNLGESLSVQDVPRNDHPSENSGSLDETVKPFSVPECQSGSDNNSGSHSMLEEGNLRKKLTYVKRRSNQLIAAASSDEPSTMGVDKAQASLSSDGYYKSKKNQLVRASSEDQNKKVDANVDLHRPFAHGILHRTSGRRQSGFAKGYRSKLSFVWKLQDAQSSDKHKKLVGPRKVWPHLFSWKKATHRRSFIHALGTKLNGGASSTASQKFLLSRRGAIYKRSTHGYSLRISKILSVSGASLKWSKSLERNSKKASEEATRAVAAAEKRKKEENGAVSVASKSRNNVSRKSVLNVKLRPGDRIFRIGSERYRMDPTRSTLHRITDAEKESSPVAAQSEKKTKISYVPRRLLIDNDEYVCIGNGNQLVRDPKKRTRVLASEKVRWSLRTARLRLVRKKKYCQFFTRFGKCNKDDGKCPYIHDPSKIAVCTKFLNGLCSNADCKLTHKVIPERMQDCSYFLKGSCSNENCPYRHVNVNPVSAVCESFLRGYCADGNECPKKHTYVCPAFEVTGTCPHASTCKLHHPKKMEKKPTIEQKIVRGRYFDGGLIADCSISGADKLSTKGSKDDAVLQEGRYPDYISLDMSDNEEMDLLSPFPKQECDETLLDAQEAESSQAIEAKLNHEYR